MCISCRPGYKFASFSLSNQCSAIENCDLTSSQSWMNACQICQSGFAWRFDSTSKFIDFGVCINAPENCLIVDDVGICFMCKEGFSWNLNSRVCSDRISNCQSLGSSFVMISEFSDEGWFGFYSFLLRRPSKPALTGCAQCVPGFLLISLENSLTKSNLSSSEFFCLESDSIGPPYVLDIASPSLPDCLQMANSASPKCAKCKPGFILNRSSHTCASQSLFPDCVLLDDISQPKCIRCSKDFVLTGSAECKSNINCLASFADSQGNLPSSFTIPADLSLCYICRAGFALDPSTPTQCKAIDALDTCDQFDYFGRCLACRHSKCPVNFVAESPVAVIAFLCDSCPYSESSLMSNMITVTVRANSQFDQVSSLSPKSLFKLRNQIKLLDEFPGVPTQICASLPSFPDCLESSAWSCLACKSGFIFDSDAFKCVASQVPFCIEYIDSSTCSRCQSDYFLQSPNLCTKRLQTHCDQSAIDRDSCVSCVDGYLPGANGSCQANSASNCSSFHPSHVSCLSCRTGFYYDLESGQCSQASISNCKLYLPNSQNCVKCAPGFVVDVIRNSCSPFSLQNCRVHHAERNECIRCRPGFYLEDSVCQPSRIRDCEFTFRLSDTCKKCKFGHSKWRSHCLNSSELAQVDLCANLDPTSLVCSRCIEGYYLEKTTSISELIQFHCLKHSSDLKCLEFDTKANQCDSCFATHSLINGNCLVLQDSNCLLPSGISRTCLRCKQGFFYSSSSNRCDVQSVANCLEYELHQNKCSVCMKGFYLVSEVICLPVTPVDHCEIYSQNSNKCQMCVEGFFEQENECLPQPAGRAYCESLVDSRCVRCSSNFVLDANGECVLSAKPIPNCKFLKRQNDGFECDECFPEFFLTSDKTTCTPKTVFGCETWADESRCLLCPTGFILESVEDKTICKKLIIENCKEVQTIEDSRYCSRCYSGYYWDSKTNKCASVTSPVANCILHDSDKTCAECKPGYLLNTQSKLCLKNIGDSLSNCSVGKTFTAESSSCATCRPGYYLTKTGICLKCNVSNCAVCDSSLDSCLICLSNFSMTTASKCLPSFEVQNDPQINPESFYLIQVRYIFSSFISLIVTFNFE